MGSGDICPNILYRPRAGQCRRDVTILWGRVMHNGNTMHFLVRQAHWCTAEYALDSLRLDSPLACRDHDPTVNVESYIPNVMSLREKGSNWKWNQVVRSVNKWNTVREPHYIMEFVKGPQFQWEFIMGITCRVEVVFHRMPVQ